MYLEANKFSVLYVDICLHLYSKILLQTYVQNNFVNARFITIITQFQVTTAMSCRALRCCMDVSYIVGHESVRSTLFQCIVSNL